MTRTILSGLIALLIGAYFSRTASPWVFVHALAGWLSIVLFDLLRFRAVQLVHAYLLGTFARILLLGGYGIAFMFNLVDGAQPAFYTFAAVVLACLFFGVAWEAGSAIHSHRR